MRLYLLGKNGNEDMVLENVKEWNESVHDRKIYVSYEDSKRKEYKDKTVVDCFVQSESERNKIMLVNDFWNTLTDEEKKETITVNGKKYNKALYDFHKGKDK